MIQQHVGYTFVFLPKLRSMDLFSRSRSNNYLDESEQVGLNGLLLDAEKELDDLPNLERDDLQRLIQCAKSLIAPIRRLPPEILTEIFVHYATENEIGAHTHIPGLTLAAVSSHWRSMSLTTPALWTTIRITPAYSYYHAYHMTLLHDILTRSSNHPLNICIVFCPLDTFRRLASSPTINFPTLHPAAVLLFGHVARWNTFQVIDFGYGLRRHSIVNDLASIRGRLTRLSAFDCCDAGDEFSSLFEGATSLHSLSVSHLAFSRSSYPWGQITEFTVSNSETSQIVQALARMDKLNTLNVHYYIKYPEWNLLDHHTVHPNLNNLNIIIQRDFDQALLENLLNMLTLPNLRSLRMSIIDPFGTMGMSMSLLSLVPLMERSTPPLTHLSLSRIRIPAEQLLGLLQSIPTLQELEIMEPSQGCSLPRMLTADFFQQLHVCHERRLLIPKLSLFDIDTDIFSVDLQEEFVKVLRCRCRESNTRDQVGRIDSATLRVRKGTFNDKTIKALMELGRLGLAVSTVDESGEITVRESAYELKES